MKTLTFNLDALLLAVLALFISLGMNVWQQYQLNELMASYTDTAWQAQDDKANLVYARTLLKACDPVKYADLKVNP